MINFSRAVARRCMFWLFYSNTKTSSRFYKCLVSTCQCTNVYDAFMLVLVDRTVVRFEPVLLVFVRCICLFVCFCIDFIWHTLNRILDVRASCINNCVSSFYFGFLLICNIRLISIMRTVDRPLSALSRS